MIWVVAYESNARADGGVGGLAEAGGRPCSEEAAGVGEPSLEGAFSPEGVDLTVIRWMLDRTPEERLQAAQQLIDAVWALRGDEA